MNRFSRTGRSRGSEPRDRRRGFSPDPFPGPQGPHHHPGPPEEGPGADPHFFGPAGFAGPFGPGGLLGPGQPFGPFGRGRGGRRRRGDVRTAVLQLLAEEPRNGYQLIALLDERTAGAWRPSPGAIYPALSQLEDEGLIETTALDDGSKAYQLTAAGHETSEVSDTTPRTWDQIKQANAPRHPGGDHAVWHEFNQLAQALKAVSISGDERQHEAAAALLAETRRRVYGLLAEPPAQD